MFNHCISSEISYTLFFHLHQILLTIGLSYDFEDKCTLLSLFFTKVKNCFK